MNVNYIKITGSNNIVIQDSEGRIIEITIADFMNRFTEEKDKTIDLLEKRIIDKEKIQALNDKEIVALSSDLNLLRSAKAELEKRISELIAEFNNKDLSEASELYRRTFSLFISGRLEEAIELLSESKLDKELHQFELNEDVLNRQRKVLADTFSFKAMMQYAKNDLVNSLQNLLQAIKLYPGSSRYWDKLSAIYLLLGKFQNAYGAMKKSIDIDLETQKEQSVTIGIKYGRIGAILIELGQISLAEQYIESAISIGNLLKSNDILIHSYTSLSHLHKLFYDYKNELVFGEMALEIALKKEDNKKNVAALFENLGTTYFSLGNYEKALHNFQMALKILKETFSEDIFIGGNIYFNIGCAKIFSNEVEEGIKLIKHGIFLSEKIYGEDNFHIARYYVFLAGSRRITKLSFNDQQHFYLKSIEIDEKYYGTFSHVTANDYYGYAIALQTEDIHDEALKYFKKAISARKSVLGRNDLTSGKWYLSLGVSCAQANNFKSALIYFEDSAMIIKENLNEEDDLLNGAVFLQRAEEQIALLKRWE